MECIKNCRKCDLYKNQNPLLEDKKYCDIMWIGLSAKMTSDWANDIPLSSNTRSGKLIQEMESSFEKLNTYHTNLVKCVPLDSKGKLRYPNKKEIEACVGHIDFELKTLKPRIVFLLGDKVKTAIEKHYSVRFLKGESFVYNAMIINNVQFVPIQHPSYMSIYKRKHIPDYENAIQNIVLNI